MVKIVKRQAILHHSAPEPEFTASPSWINTFSLENNVLVLFFGKQIA